jgi:transcriptional regulator with XRE-family HTH domain
MARPSPLFLTQIQVAKELGISNTTVSMWETGNALPSAKLLPKIAALYNCTVDELLKESAPETAQTENGGR